ncbi:MAG: alpha-amylase [Magnetococcales bacterium]|nr:alpha-amylase [Magnetococcales bacterium]
MALQPITSTSDINWKELQKRRYTPSPESWEDQLLYFMMLDRFSDNREKGYCDNNGSMVTQGTTPLFNINTDASKADWNVWYQAGGQWCGGTLKGATSKMGYLARMGITTIWISPVFKQRSHDDGSYHGYGIQNFLDVDPHFGTANDLKELVETAHRHGIYVILDIILNHAGDVFAYSGGNSEPLWNGGHFPVAGFRDQYGNPRLPFAANANPGMDDAIWPKELQAPDTFTRKGRINNWDYFPEYLEGDFCSLKDITHGYYPGGDQSRYAASPAFTALCDSYRYWIAFADIDGYRLDTVKHMDMGAVRAFVTIIHEYAQSIGKERFFLVGEITGGRDNAFTRLEETGLDAALGIDDLPDKLHYVAKGYRNPSDYFDLFRNSEVVGKSSHKWFGGHVVTMIDDHDQVFRGNSKARFCGDPGMANPHLYLPASLALNLLTMGVPCVYYGTEQQFNGQGDSDRFLRECMFGGPFGSLRSSGVHFFNETHGAYQLIAKLAQVRKTYQSLRRGRQYLRDISTSGDPDTFGPPIMIGGQIRSVVPWSRLFADEEVLVAVNTDVTNSLTVWVTVDAFLNAPGSFFQCVLSTDPNNMGLKTQVTARNGSAIQLTVPKGGVVVYVPEKSVKP